MSNDANRWGMSNNTNRKDLFETQTLFITRHDPFMGKPGYYRVVAKNVALARAQGVDWGNVHFNAVVDDYGNLVRTA